MKDLAVVSLSGGLDSCVTTAIAAQSHDLALLHFTYAQRTQNREQQAFTEIADFYKLPDDRRLILNADYFTQIGGSALTDLGIPVPKADLTRKEVPITYVPFRNAHLLCLATSWAEVLGARSIFIGVVQEDSSGYPDCTEAFCKAFALAIEAGTRPDTRIDLVTPLIHLHKSQIVRTGKDLNAPLHLTWSCYDREDAACGRCDSCILRLRAFEQAGVRDPISYQ